MQDAKKVASYKLQDKKQVSSYELRKDKESCKMQDAGSHPVCQSAGLPVENKYKYKEKI